MEHSLTTLPLVSIVIGTEPEAIKLAPVIMSFQKCNSIRTRIILTGQNREIVNHVMKLFQISPDRDLEVIVRNQTLTHITSSILKGLKDDFLVHRPDLLLVQGHTTTAFASALAAFYEQIPIGHVEAGVRTKNKIDSFPEETNRCLISQLTSLHFSSNIQSAANLRAAGVIGEIHVTGNTIVDALLLMANKSIRCNVNGINWEKNRVILATVHRRETGANSLNNIAHGFLQLLERYTDIVLLLPLHMDSTIREPLKKILGTHPRAFLVEPLRYDSLVAAIRNCTLILTDSGEIQEEAPTFGKLVLIMQYTTEHLEAIEGGTARLIGTNSADILRETSMFLDNPNMYNNTSKAYNPFGDGEASGRILAASRAFLKC